MSLYAGLGRGLLFALDAERAHGLSIAALRHGIVPAPAPVADPRLRVRIAGLDFPNPVGLAAGYDKNAEIPDAMLRLGFGHVEVGTLTPRAQAGNAKPRIFRLKAHDAVINRLGFNNGGHAAALERLRARRDKGGLIGVNIGANKDSADFVADYVMGIEAFWDVASYFTANISSPNTPGLRNLQGAEALRDLLQRVIGRRDGLSTSTGAARPVFLKIAPDLDDGQMDAIAEVIAASRLDGLIVSNTTLSRFGVTGAAGAGEAGGLSGRPLFERSTIVLARMRQRLGRAFPIIGVGGIDGPAAALDKLRAGADLVQLYTGMIYRGPGLAREICGGILAELERRAMSGAGELVGLDNAAWAARAIDGRNGGEER